MVHYNNYRKTSLAIRLRLVLVDNLQSQQPGSNKNLSYTESSANGLDLRNLQDESPLDSSDSSCKFLVRKDLLGKIRVSDFIVLVSDFIVGFPTLLLLDNNTFFREVPLLLHRHRLRQIPWLIHIASPGNRGVIREQLQGDDCQ